MTDAALTDLAADMAAALNPAVNVLLVATAHAQVLRNEVDAIKARILGEDVYTDDLAGERVTAPDLDYCMSEDAMGPYGAKLDTALRAAGLAYPDGRCHALVAADTRRKAEAVLFDLASSFAPFAHCDAKTMNRQKTEVRTGMLENLLGLVITHPAYVAVA